MADLAINTLEYLSAPAPVPADSLLLASNSQASITLAAASAEHALSGINLALHRPAASSTQESDAFSAASAVDGSQGTRWASTWTDPQWIYVDLGTAYNINRVVLHWEAYAKSYEIQVSDNKTQWQNIYSTNAGKGGTETINVKGKGRYVRVYMNARVTEYGDSLFEFEVYGEGNNTPTTTNSAAISNVNKALDKPATSSSAESNVWSASHAVDGSRFSRWSSGFNDNEWICVDLGSVQPVNRIVLKWESAFARAYKLQVSDDNKTWKDIYNTTAGDGDVDDIKVSATGRYVRMQGLVRSTEYGYSLWEFEIY